MAVISSEVIAIQLKDAILYRTLFIVAVSNIPYTYQAVSLFYGCRAAAAVVVVNPIVQSSIHAIDQTLYKDGRQIITRV